jgi:hypothetical protein
LREPVVRLDTTEQQSVTRALARYLNSIDVGSRRRSFAKILFSQRGERADHSPEDRLGRVPALHHDDGDTRTCRRRLRWGSRCRGERARARSPGASLRPTPPGILRKVVTAARSAAEGLAVEIAHAKAGVLLGGRISEH